MSSLGINKSETPVLGIWEALNNLGGITIKIAA
ncbi:Uncharacterised protein [Shewanella putrefaciens]|uniref:Uncharacterized protein n=1 Tax=Shewanella putrefaciens (strain 200) TaxID=399804 RepID=E6XPU5_SHEP2|nr:hypothetical protein [Shewanella putrefaciens]CAD6364080.1 hypothetical protein SHEWT2_01904 [Shewanella hafniensis]SUI50874.1 Uncharacterised protein [Shewanella putrefaciens]